MACCGGLIAEDLALARLRRQRAACCPIPCCLPPDVTTPSSVFEARFPNTISPFVVLAQVGNGTATPGDGFAELIAISPPGVPAVILIGSPAPIVDPSTQSFCLTVLFAVDPLQNPALGQVPAATGLADLAGTDVGALIYDFASGNVFLFTSGPGGQEFFNLGPADTAPHLWRITGTAATQTYTISKDGGAPITFTPIAGNYPQAPLNAAAFVTAESPGVDTVQNRMVMNLYCATAGAPPSLLTGFGASQRALLAEQSADISAAILGPLGAAAAAHMREQAAMAEAANPTARAIAPVVPGYPFPRPFKK